MFKLLIFYVYALEAFRPVLREGECPDEDLAILCDSYCYIDFVECKDACDSSGCERTCLAEYTDCYIRCPCFDLCPSGCEDCSHSVCTCRSPEIDNVDYRQCIKEVTDDFVSCYGNCTADETCYGGCSANLAQESKKCPCNSGCPLGCPCENGYTCQKYIAAMCQSSYSGNVDFSYIISANGHIQENRYYSSPSTSTQFLYSSGSAMLNGQMYLFGGSQDAKKIAKIDECLIEDTGKRLINNFYATSGSLTTIPEVLEETVLCNSNSAALKCESFNGETIRAISDVKVQHQYACMTLYLGQAVIIAGQQSSSVEILEFSGWQDLTTHPAGSKFYYHTCASTEDGIITVGGYDGSSYVKDVYFFKNNQWSIAGQMQNYQRYASMIILDSFFIVFGGTYDHNTVERAEWQNDTIISTSVLHDHGGNCIRPIIFETTPDQCREFCSQDFCYLR